MALLIHSLLIRNVTRPYIIFAKLTLDTAGNLGKQPVTICKSVLGLYRHSWSREKGCVEVLYQIQEKFQIWSVGPSHKTLFKAKFEKLLKIIIPLEFQKSNIYLKRRSILSL